MVGGWLDVDEAQLERYAAGERTPLGTVAVGAPSQGLLPSSESYHLCGLFILPPPRTAGAVVLKIKQGSETPRVCA